ncbi:hypothetical protein ACFLT9_13045, partial [Acidobacteriota bacterium]
MNRFRLSYNMNRYSETMKKLAVPILIFFNGILLTLSWIMAFYAYPRLPNDIPMWLAFAGQEIIRTPKTELFFLYPTIQSAFNILFSIIGLTYLKKRKSTQKFKDLSIQKRQEIQNLKKEYIFLVLIFFNLIFIHIGRSLILTAHGIEEG